MAFRIKSSAKEMKGIYILLSVMSFVFFVLSSSVIPFMSPVGKTSGDALFCFVCCIPAFVPRKSAVIYALILGFLADLFINAPTSFSPVIYLVSVVVAFYFYGFFSRVGSLVIAVCALPCLVIKGVVDTFSLMAQFEDSTASAVIGAKTFPSLVLNFAFAIVIAFILRTITKKFRIFYAN